MVVKTMRKLKQKINAASGRLTEFPVLFDLLWRIFYQDASSQAFLDSLSQMNKLLSYRYTNRTNDTVRLYHLRRICKNRLL